MVSFDKSKNFETDLSPAIELLEIGKYQEAQKWLSRFLKINPKQPEALSLLSQVLLLDKKELEAEQNLLEAASLNPDLPSVYRNQARLLLKKSKPVEALEKAQLLFNNIPNDPENLLILAACLGANNRDSEALPILDKILENNSEYAEAYANRALIKLRCKDISSAIKDFEKTVSLKPHLTQIWVILGSLFHKRNEILMAINAIRNAIKNEPENVTFMNNLGEFLRLANKTSEAINVLKEAIKLKPDDANIWTNLGVAFQQEKKIIDARLAFKKAMALNPHSAKIANNLGVLTRDIGKLNKALGYFKKALEIEPNLAEAHNNLGMTLNEIGRFKEAEASLNHAITLKSDYVEAYNNLGSTLKELGKFEECELSYNKAIALNPDYALTHYNLGNLLHQLGRLDDAEARYSKAILLNPNFAEAWNNIFFTLKALQTQNALEKELLPKINDLPNTQYSQIAKIILNYKLNLAGENNVHALNQGLKIISKMDNIQIKNPEYKTVPNILENRIPEKIIALVHFGRSGTGLMHSLIDNHPQVSTLPSIYFSEYFNPSTWEKIISSGWEKMIDRFINIYDVFFDSTSKIPIQSKGQKLIYDIGHMFGMTSLGDKKDEILAINKVEFQAELQKLMKFYNVLNSFEFFKLVHLAYQKLIGDKKEKNLIFYHIHNPDIITQLNFMQFAPNVSWLIMVREPLQSCESWIRDSFVKKKYDEIVFKILDMLYEIDKIIYQQQNAIGVRLEDLKDSPKKIMPILCRWMGIEETSSLYEMTAQGKKWWGDPHSPDYETDGMNPFGKTSVSRKIGSIFSTTDQYILRTLFYPFNVRFGYTQKDQDQFELDLEKVRPMLDRLFDFEKVIIENTKSNKTNFMKSGSYLFFRSCLIERWNTLKKFGSYPNTINSLLIH